MRLFRRIFTRKPKIPRSVRKTLDMAGMMPPPTAYDGGRGPQADMANLIEAGDRPDAILIGNRTGGFWRDEPPEEEEEGPTDE